MGILPPRYVFPKDGSIWFDPIHQLVEVATRRKAERDEAIIRELLGRWISELESSLAIGPNGEILGLCQADTEIGDTPFILRVRS